MKKKVLSTVLVLILCAAAYTAGILVADYMSPAPVSNAPSKFESIVRLTLDGRTFCTGTVVAPNLIITAAHCVLMETPFGMMMRTGEIDIRPSTNVKTTTTAKVVYASPQMDQAMLTGNFSAYKTRRFITDPAKLSDLRVKNTKFISCGFPLNGNMFCTETTFDKNSDFFWDVNGVLIPGMSGGPSMLPDGTVIAVNVAVHGDKAVISPIYNITKNLEAK